MSSSSTHYWSVAPVDEEALIPSVDRETSRPVIVCIKPVIEDKQGNCLPEQSSDTVIDVESLGDYDKLRGYQYGQIVDKEAPIPSVHKETAKPVIERIKPDIEDKQENSPPEANSDTAACGDSLGDSDQLRGYQYGQIVDKEAPIPSVHKETAKPVIERIKPDIEDKQENSPPEANSDTAACGDSLGDSVQVPIANLDNNNTTSLSASGEDDSNQFGGFYHYNARTGRSELFDQSSTPEARDPFSVIPRDPEPQDREDNARPNNSGNVLPHSHGRGNCLFQWSRVLVFALVWLITEICINLPKDESKSKIVKM